MHQRAKPFIILLFKVDFLFVITAIVYVIKRISFIEMFVSILAHIKRIAYGCEIFIKMGADLGLPLIRLFLFLSTFEVFELHSNKGAHCYYR